MTSDKLSSRNQTASVGPDTQVLAEAFCLWPLPPSVCSDPCVTVPGYPNRTGTNLITVAEAKAMFDHLVDRGLLQVGVSVEDGGADPRKADLTMKITGGKLVISIGIDALAIAVEANPLLEEGEDFEGPKVTNPDRFASELLAALQDEDEQGNNAFHRALDEAALAAVENGAEGIRVAGDGDD